MMMEKLVLLAIQYYFIDVEILSNSSSLFQALIHLPERLQNRAIVTFLKLNLENKIFQPKNFQLEFLLLLYILMTIHLLLQRLVPIPQSLSTLIHFSKRTALSQVVLLIESYFFKIINLTVIFSNLTFS